jgi:hypothetical protein
VASCLTPTVRGSLVTGGEILDTVSFNMKSRFFFAAALLMFTWAAAGLAQTGGEKKKDGEPKKDAEQITEKTLIGGKNLAEWIKDISSSDRSQTELALTTVVNYGPELAVQAVPAMIAELKKQVKIDMSVRMNAPVAISIILTGLKKPDENMIKDAVAAMRKLVLKDTESIVRYRTIESLGRMGPMARDSIPELAGIHAIGNGETWQIRHASAVALGTVAIPIPIDKGPPPPPAKEVVDALCKAASVSDEKAVKVRLAALSSMMNLSLAMVPNYQALLRSKLNAVIAKEPDTLAMLRARVVIFPALATPTERKAQIDTVATYLDKAEVSLANRLEAVSALNFYTNYVVPDPKEGAKAGPQPHKAQALDAMVKHGLMSAAPPPQPVKLAVVAALDRAFEKDISGKAGYQKTLNLYLTKESDPICRIRAHVTLFAMATAGAEKRPIVQAVVAYLAKNQDSHVRCEAAQAIGHLGKEATSDADQQLMECVNDKDYDVAVCSIQALAQISATKALPRLAAITKDESMPPVLRAAARDATDIINGVGKKKEEPKKGSDKQ